MLVLAHDVPDWHGLHDERLLDVNALHYECALLDEQPHVDGDGLERDALSELPKDCLTSIPHVRISLENDALVPDYDELHAHQF